jgi:pimeloyl-ACP methyl ester carboxylesterase
MTPETRYANSGGVSIAYQVLGEGPLDLIVVTGFASNLDTYWEEPNVDRFYRRLASFSRLILFDKRGTGLSDRVADLPSLEVRMDDVRAVMDAVDHNTPHSSARLKADRCVHSLPRPIPSGRQR